MKPQRIILVRHGESQSNVDRAARETIRDHQIALTPTGWDQAEEAGLQILRIMQTMPPDYWCRQSSPYLLPRRVQCYVSPFARTRETFAGIRSVLEPEIGKVREDPRLREQEWGHLRTVEESERVDQERTAHSPFYYRIPDGESGADVYDRCTGFLDTLYRDFEKHDFPPAVLIVGHGFSLRVLLMRWLHWTVEEFEAKRNLRNCEVLQLALQRDLHYLPFGPFLEDKVNA